MTPTTAQRHRLFDRLSQGLLVGAFLTFPVALALGNVLAALCVVATLLSGHLRTQWRKVFSLPSAWAMLLLFVLILAGTSYTSAPASMALLHLSKYAKLLAGLFFVSVLFDAKTRRHCLYAFMAAMGFILVSAYAGIFVTLPWSATQQTGWGVDHTVVGDYITQSVMMGFFVLTCLAFLWKFKSPWARAGWIILALLGTVSITHLAWGRTGAFLLVSSLVVAGLAELAGGAFVGPGQGPADPRRPRAGRRTGRLRAAALRREVRRAAPDAVPPGGPGAPPPRRCGPFGGNFLARWATGPRQIYAISY